MATYQHSSLLGGQIRVQLQVHDQTDRVTAVEVFNRSELPLRGRVYENGVLAFTAVAPAGQDTSWNVGRVQLTLVDGELSMDGYVIEASV